MAAQDKAAQLAELAAQIAREHEAATEDFGKALAHMRNGLERRRAIGRLLLQARAIVGTKPRGAWAAWIDKNCPFRTRWARVCLSDAADQSRHDRAELEFEEVLEQVAGPGDSELVPLDLPSEEEEEEPPPSAEPPPGSPPPPPSPSEPHPSEPPPSGPPPLTEDQRRAEQARKNLLGALGVLDQFDPERMAASTRNPEQLWKTVEPLYQKLRLLVNSLYKRLHLDGKPQQESQFLAF